MTDNGTEPTVTSGLQWRKPREVGYIKELPSGATAALRPVSPDLLIMDGDIPDILTSMVVKMVFDGAKGDELQDLSDPTSELSQTKEVVELLNRVCRLAFVKPRIVDEPQADDEIHIDDVSLGDRAFIFTLCTQPAEVLRSFRLQPNGDVETVPDSEGESQPTE